MKKHALLIVGVVLLIVEISLITLMPSLPSPEDISTEPVLIDLEYVPYMMTALTCSFIAFFTLLISGIFIVLKSQIREKAWEMIVLFVAFIVPILAYGWFL